MANKRMSKRIKMVLPVKILIDNVTHLADFRVQWSRQLGPNELQAGIEIPAAAQELLGRRLAGRI